MTTDIKITEIKDFNLKGGHIIDGFLYDRYAESIAVELMARTSEFEFADNYKLMKVCNSHLAKQVVEANPDLGLLLPYIIAVYQKNNEDFISLARSTSLLSMISEDNLKISGEEIEEGLIKTIENTK